MAGYCPCPFKRKVMGVEVPFHDNIMGVISRLMKIDLK